MLKGMILGNLGADAKIVEGTNFKKFVSLSVAHSEKFYDNDGQLHERTMWCNVIINWDCTNLMPYLIKGTKIFAIGKIKLRAFNSREGILSASCDIVATEIELAGSPHITPPTTVFTQHSTETEDSEEPF